MIVIAVGQSKGGVGKTTLAVNVTGEIARYGKRVTLVDCDPQGSATQWAELRRLPFPVRHELLVNRNQLLWVRNILKVPTDIVVVDLPSGFGPLFETAVFVADLLVVPCGPSSLDIGAAHKTILKAKELRRLDLVNGLKIVTVPTRLDLANEESTQIREALEDLGEPVGPALSYDVNFVRSFTAGATVSDLDETGQASAEVKKLSVFLLRQILPRGDAVAS